MGTAVAVEAPPHRIAAGSRTRRTGTSRKGLILFTLCLAALIINIDVTIVNVTLPSLVRELGATTTNLQWVVDAYTLVFAALILAAGSLSDRVGRKGVLLLGLGVFAAGSLAGSLVDTPGALIAARVVMGVGAAGIFPATLSLIANVFTERKERAMAIGLWGATTGVGVALGPIAGGWLLEHFWWGSVFLVSLPIMVLVLAAGPFVLPEYRDKDAGKPDLASVALSIASVLAIVFGLKGLGITGAQAVGFALLARFVIFAPITLAGLVLLVARYGGLRRLRSG